MDNIKAVIFDLDGVITDSAHYHYMAWKELADELNIPFDQQYNEKLKGVSRMDSLELLLKNGDKVFSQSEKEAMCDRKNDAYKELIKQITPEDILPGISTFLAELKQHNIKTAVASVSKNAFFIIHRLALIHSFDYIVDANEIKRSKPYPDIFLAAAEALGVAAWDCVGIEDAQAGIEAIKAAGMTAVGVGTHDQMRDADLILSATAELSLAALQDFMRDNPYLLTEDALHPNELMKNETLFHVANGYVGVRGNFEEGYDGPTIRGTYINGFYDIGDLKYTEKFTGFPTEYQKLINVIDVQGMQLWINDERFSLFDGTVLQYKRTLDMKKGIMTRYVTWRSPQGHEIQIKIERMASFAVPSLFVIRYHLKSINFDGTVKMISSQNADVNNFSDSNDPRLAHESIKNIIHEKNVEKNDCSYMCVKTSRSHLQLISAVCHDIPENARLDRQDAGCLVEAIITCDIKKGEVKQFIKYAIFVDSIRYPDCLDKAEDILHSVRERGLDYWFTRQRLYLKDFWENSDIRINSTDHLNRSINFSLFSLLQSVGKDRHSNIAAKGLSGEGYEGHYFWDTEIYIFPFFLLTNPTLAYNLLSYRYDKLPQARENARLLGHTQGALFPWRTISGTECSSYFPSGSAQYHINGDIAYSFINYYLVTGDLEMVRDMGAEVLFEMARLWMDVGHFDDGCFKIDCVTGPDEYTCLINNNYYTNASAKYSLHWACQFYYLLKSSGGTDLMESLQIKESEVAAWGTAAEKMYLPIDEKYHINPQDDSFLRKKPWDFEHTPLTKYPLLLHYHPLHIYRHQVLKQADTVLAHFLFEDYQSLDIIKNSYAYYEKITTHDSSLSTCIYGIMASKIDLNEKAYDYFMQTAKLDLEDTHNNTSYGLHTACMGGAYISIVYGFAGLRIKADGLHFKPQLPDAWQAISFTIHYKNVAIGCEIDKGNIYLRKNGGEAMCIWINGRDYHLEASLNVALA